MPETAISEQPDSRTPFNPAYLFTKWGMVLFVLFLMILPLSCADLSRYDEEQIRTTLNDSLITTTESWDVEMVLMQDGNTRMYIEGSYAINYQSNERKESRISGPVYVQIFDSLGSVETQAWSNSAIYHEAEAEFELFDSVRVQTVNDRHLFSDYLKWSQDTDRITSPYFVIIITPTDSISGRGFEGVTDLSSYTITEPRGRLIID
jgi:LPS export ABC transporter protein LptC